MKVMTTEKSEPAVNSAQEETVVVVAAVAAKDSEMDEERREGAMHVDEGGVEEVVVVVPGGGGGGGAAGTMMTKDGDKQVGGEDFHNTCSDNSSFSTPSSSSTSSSSTSNTSSTSTTPSCSPHTPHTSHTTPSSPSQLSSSSSSSSTSSSTPSESSTTTTSSSSSPSTINIEDSDKKYVAMETNKPKTWLAAYNSLAPRTRQTVRTAVIAIVSALALVAIFHLAKLAEHPVSENVIEEPPKKEGTKLEGREASEEWRGEEVFKGADGKVFGAQGGGSSWLGAQFEAGVRGGNGGLQDTSPVLDVLARARPAIHPILNVPVDRDFMRQDVERLREQQRADKRPANASEVAATLSLVRRHVEAERKLLNTKNLRLWSAGEAPLRVLLVATWRSGSTFLAQALSSHPAVFHHYEPFSPRGVRQVRSGRDAFQAQQLLHRLLDCQFEGQTEYLNYTRQHPADMLGHNREVWDACHRGPNFNACYNASFLSQACQMFPVQLVKTVRLRLNLTQLFLNDERMNVKVVFLVRDPRATMSSRYSSVGWCTDHPDCASPDVLCSDMQADLKVATALQQLYPDRFIQVKYEDIALDPQTQVRSLMSFLGMEFTASTARFVQEHTQANQNSPWSIKRKSSDRVTMWKKQLPLQEVHAIQNVCEPVMKSLQYEVLGQ